MEENETITIRLTRAYPVFPLNDVVLLPNTILPLNIFEPRYRRMVGDCLDDEGLLALGMFAGPVDREEYIEGRPPLRPYVGIGLIVEYERASEGRYLILLRGVCRARIVREEPHEPYRTALLAPVDIARADEPALAVYRDRLDAFVRRRMVNLGPDAGDPLLVAPSVPTRMLADRLCDALCADAEQKYALLAEPDATRRCEWLLRRIGELEDA